MEALKSFLPLYFSTVQLSERRSETRLQNAFVRALDRLGTWYLVLDRLGTPDVGCVIKLSPLTVKSGLVQLLPGKVDRDTTKVKGWKYN